ncbi:hypothetical protein Taro_030870 [Colocasia esculenta]|uniref:Uncharacterized protein n=1 Tax=Colocasia esculenta TaxID=4460 RepID=A0A843VV65_COLES|nr:hypothetical protein [Colocasia esculenta]
MRSHRRPATTLPERNFAPERKSPNSTFYRPVRSADSELGSRGWFRPPGEQISASDRRGWE